MGSLIWNSAKQHRSLIQQHSFWEVKDGKDARFWDDSWQQLPKLRYLLHPLQIPAQDLQDHNKVNIFWRSPIQDTRQWIEENQILRDGTEQAQKILEAELMRRRIQCSEERDVLRWGYGEKGVFSTKEAYNIIIKEHMVKDNLWRKVWDSTN